MANPLLKDFKCKWLHSIGPVLPTFNAGLDEAGPHHSSQLVTLLILFIRGIQPPLIQRDVTVGGADRGAVGAVE